jgi:hypothetical protein
VLEHQRRLDVRHLVLAGEMVHHQAAEVLLAAGFLGGSLADVIVAGLLLAYALVPSRRAL